MLSRKIWCEFCFSQNQLLCLTIPQVNQYLSKHDVEEYSLIPNSQLSLVNDGIPCVVKFDLVAKRYTGSPVIMHQFTG